VSAATSVAEISEIGSEDSVDAAVAEEMVSSAGSTQSSEPSVAASPTESFEETLLDRDDPERLDEAET
jgi:hypothetical protein